MTVPMLDIPLSVLLRFSGNGRLYRAFDHIIAAADGSLLVVPVQHVAGSLQHVIDGCPVPWDEVLDIIEQPGVSPNEAVDIAAVWQRLDCFYAFHQAMRFDRLALTGGYFQNIIRVSHPSGLRFAIAV